MISLLEKEARDPGEVLRVKLKDSTETSLLNSQLLREIKNDYLAKQNVNKGQLDGFVQAHVDDIERASALLELESPVNEIVESLDALSHNCRKMNEELGDKKLSSGISIARRNLKELENQIVFYDELPTKLQELNIILDGGHFEVVPIYTKWQVIDEWRQKMLQELKLASIDKMDELGNSKAQARILSSMSSRMESIESVQSRIMGEVWGCMHHCVEVAQFNKRRLASAFEVLDMMEKRRRKYVDTKKEYLNNQLKVVAEYQTPCHDKCKSEIMTYLARSVDDMFRFVEKEAQEKGQKPLNAILDAANHLVMDLEIVQSEVVGCFPSDIDVINLFTSSYNTQLEGEITKICSQPDIGIAERLQLVQWIEYYNSEIVKYKRARPSGVLDQISQTLMSQYLDQIREQIQTWVTNVWKREEERVIGPNGELQSTRPNDIINILKSQISIGQEWLTGKLVGRVVVACLQTLMGQLKLRYESFALRLEEVDIESLCSFINEADILQSKCPELVEEISFAERDSEEKEAFDAFMGDGLDTTSTEIVRYAVDTCNLLVDKLFRDIEQDTSRLWFSKKWDEGERVVENLLVTLEDYFADLKQWISGSFFFSKVVRQCLDECAKEYVKRLLVRTHCFSSPPSSAAIIENDNKNFVTFFNKYASELRRTGIRSINDIEKEFEALELISGTLRGVEPPELLEGDVRKAVDQVIKLMRSTSNQETVASGDKKAKDKKAKETKKKAKEKEKLEKEKLNKKDKKDSKKDKNTKKEAPSTTGGALLPTNTKESTPRESTPPTNNADNDGFEVQSLNMADFLGG